MQRKVFIGIIVAVALVAGAVVLRLVQNPFQQAIAIRSADSAFHSRRLNILLLGYQADEGNSDTVILAHLDIGRRTATLVSIPRDTWVQIPGHGRQKINAAIGFGGPSLSAKVVSTLVGAPIDATVALQPEGAKQLVDAMGGMNVNVERDMDYDDNFGDLHIHLKKGEQYMTGGQVLEYVRYRNDAESDWGRVRRQQGVLKALLDQLSQPQNWAKLPKLLPLARKDMQTNLSDPQLAALLEIYRGVPDDNVRTLTMPGRATFVGDASVVVVDDRWARLIGSLLCSKHDPPAGSSARCERHWGSGAQSQARGGAARRRLERRDVRRAADAGHDDGGWIRRRCRVPREDLRRSAQSREFDHARRRQRLRASTGLACLMSR